MLVPLPFPPRSPGVCFVFRVTLYILPVVHSSPVEVRTVMQVVIDKVCDSNGPEYVDEEAVTARSV